MWPLLLFARRMGELGGTYRPSGAIGLYRQETELPQRLGLPQSLEGGSGTAEIRTLHS